MHPVRAQPGDWVLASLPPAARHLAAQRQYVPVGIPVLKQIGAVGGDHVCNRGGTLWINAKAIAQTLTQDSRGRPLAAWEGCRVLHPQELFLLSLAHPSSYDSRYFGPVALPAVHGRARPLWAWSTP
ncbi:S26 family signal peptidase [Alcaligenes faecalis]|nr:S26 family signal peptidase [Alcaligenes faecalis]